MSNDCDDLDALHDGELCAAAAARMRTHVADCHRCQVRLLELSMMRWRLRRRPSWAQQLRDGAGLVRAVATDLAVTAAWFAGLVVIDAGLWLAGLNNSTTEGGNHV